MALETGTFPKLDPGTDNNPDFYSGPDALASTEQGLVQKIVSTTATHTTVKFIKRTMVDGDLDLLREQVKGTALFDDSAWNALDAAGKANFIRTAMQKIIKQMLRGTP